MVKNKSKLEDEGRLTSAALPAGKFDKGEPDKISRKSAPKQPKQ